MSSVQIDAAAIYTINAHVNEFFPAPCGGILLSPPVNVDPDTLNAVEVTESFALPPTSIENGALQLKSKETSSYIKFLLSRLKEVKSDSQVAGWYISCSVSSIFDAQIFENMYHMQTQNPDSFVLVHDVALSRVTGTLCIRAFQLGEQYMAVRKTGTSHLTTEQLTKHNLSYGNLVVELPVCIAESNLVSKFLAVHAPDTPMGCLKVPDEELLERHADASMATIDDLNYDQGNYNYYQRLLAREKQKIQQWKTKRVEENAERAKQGQKPLSLDEYRSVFKLPEEPARLEALLLSAQLDEQCTQVEEIAGAIASTLVPAKFI